MRVNTERHSFISLELGKTFPIFALLNKYHLTIANGASVVLGCIIIILIEAGGFRGANTTLFRRGTS